MFPCRFPDELFHQPREAVIYIQWTGFNNRSYHLIFLDKFSTDGTEREDGDGISSLSFLVLRA